MKIRTILFSVMTACVAAILFPAVSSRAESGTDIIDGVIAEGVYIGGVKAGGMTEAEAKAAVDRYMKESGQEELQVRVDSNFAGVTFQELGLRWSNRDVVAEAVALGKTGNLLKRYKDLISLQYENYVFELETELNDRKLTDFIQEEVVVFNQDVKEPSLSRSGGVFHVEPSASGIKVDMEKTAQAIQDAILGVDTFHNIRVDAVCEVTKPKHDSSELKAVQEVLSTYSTSYDPTNQGRTQSLELSASRLNGVVIYPGETISVSTLMGERSQKGGYGIAQGYVGTQTVDMLGAGICQTATTLYCASLYADMKIVERKNHTKTVSYVPHAMDATIYAGDDYRNPLTDLKLRNDFKYPVYIESSAKGGKCTFTIYGKKENPEKKVDYVSTTFYEVYPDPAFVEDPTLPYGVTVQVQGAYPDVKASLTKIVTVNGVETERSVLHTDKYKPANAIFAVGTGPAAEVQPSEGGQLPPVDGAQFGEYEQPLGEEGLP